MSEIETGLFSCHSPMHCVVSAFAPCYFTGKLEEERGGSFCGGCVAGLCCGSFCGALQRHKVLEYMEKSQGLPTDVCVGFWCFCCSNVQLYKELREYKEKESIMKAPKTESIDYGATHNF